MHRSFLSKKEEMLAYLNLVDVSGVSASNRPNIRLSIWSEMLKAMPGDKIVHSRFSCSKIDAKAAAQFLCNLLCDISQHNFVS